MSGDFAKETPKDIFFARLKKFSNETFSKRMLGFSFSRAWVFLVFFNETALVSPVGEQVLTEIYQGSLFVLVLTLFACGLMSRLSEKFSSSTAARIAPAIFCIVGTSAIPFASLESPAGYAMLAVAAVATGVGSGLLLLLWGKIYSLEGGPSTAAEVSVSYVLATLLVPFYHATTHGFQMIIVSVLPIASSALMARELKRVKTETSEEQTDEMQHRAMPENGSLGYAGILVKFAISSVVFGCVISVVRFFYTANATVDPGAYPSFVFPLSALLVGCVMLGIVLFSRRLDLAFSYKPVLIFMALGCLMLPFFEANYFLSYTFALTGYFCFEIVSWVMLSDMTFRFGVPAFKAYGFGRCAVSGGVLLGSLLISWLAESVNLSSQFRFAAACLMLFVMIVAYTLTLTERDIARMHRRSMDRFETQASRIAPSDAWKSTSGDESAREPLSLEEKVAIIAEQHQVSGRALEVMTLLAQGRTAARIEQELYISRGTVNTYSHRLYQKLGVHSRQELLDLIYSVEE
ncbi:hypothetical protein GS424_006260 [Eggerthella guodeyinii]|uniref:Uncharacterized protein n=1 Tax=Eggerthella guodeyinii TaxID=2690837 RepID=A0A6L7IV57_9ACTN|nr:LuxR family transcriptional regulator [Eggerthella guodeyinii]QOS69443.1 hypothetical protein GS424_006260 [Eggerthella guodeyinii]